jgi:alpha-D-xyloside xylohydrolase
MPYIYSLGYHTWLTGAPFMRALPLDFPNDPKVADLRDEYMFGPAFLVAPVTEQGATSREVYLPAGSDWYNYWTNERVKGGQTITVQAPIDTIPLFVRAGSIIPLGAPVESTHEVQAIAKVRVYPGADASFTLFSRRRQDVRVREAEYARLRARIGRYRSAHLARPTDLQSLWKQGRSE